MLHLLTTYSIIVLTLTPTSYQVEKRTKRCNLSINCLDDINSDKEIDRIAGDNKRSLDEETVGDIGNITRDADGLKLEEKEMSNKRIRRDFSVDNSSGIPSATFRFSLLGNTSGMLRSKWLWDGKGFNTNLDVAGDYETQGKGISSFDWGPANIIGKYYGNVKGGGKFGYDLASGNENSTFQSNFKHHLFGDGNAKFRINFFDENMGNFDTFGEFRKMKISDSFDDFDKDGSFKKKYNSKSFNDYFTNGEGSLNLGSFSDAGGFIRSGISNDNDYFNRKFQKLSSGWKFDEDSWKNRWSKDRFKSFFTKSETFTKKKRKEMF